MIPKNILNIIICPSCRADEIGVGGKRHPELECGSCGVSYPFTRGIVDLTPRFEGEPVRHYRTETLYDAIAPLFDVAFPAMSMLVWNCPPLRYVDWAHRALGRAEDGILLTCPVGTGFLLNHVQSDHTRFPIVATDISWRMLSKAQARFERSGATNVTLIRADPAHLPFRQSSFRSIMTLNGLNGFHDRDRALSELVRVTEKRGWIAGSALCRGLERTADRVLHRYEKWGVYPILRGREFLLAELEQAFRARDLRFETYGAVVFFITEVGTAEFS